MGFLRRFGIAVHGREIVIPAVILGFVLGPQLFQRHDGFTGLRPPVVEIAPHDGCFLAVPAGADAEDKPAPAILVQCGDLFSQDQRITLGEQCNAGAKLDLAGDGRSPGQCDIRVGNIPKLGLVINGIGQYDKNVQSRKGVLVEEFNKYREWAKSLRLVNEDNSSQKNAFLEYDDKKYHIFFRDV